MQNQDLTEMGVRLAEHLAKDTEISEYVSRRFPDRKLTVVVGPPEVEIPGEEDTPYIFVYDFSKTEGATANTATYQAMFGIGIYTEDSSAATSEGVIVYAGQQYCSELMTLVQKSLYKYKNDSFCLPPDSIESYIPAPPYASKYHYEGFLAASWELELYLGADIKF